MIITDFTLAQAAEAEALALGCYEAERREAIALPVVGAIDLTCYADNGMGVVAYEGKRMVGFLLSALPFDDAFHSTGAKGVFSPMGANGAVEAERAKIYAAMYESAARKWVDAGAVSHGICLYAHDALAVGQFFRYGFGMRCVDAVRHMEEIDCGPFEGYECAELPAEDYGVAYEFEVLLHEHCQSSPFFMNRQLMKLEDFCASCVRDKDRCFVALYRGSPCAYLRISKAGETFISDRQDYCHITGAFCLQEHRGRGVYVQIVNHAVRVLKQEGFSFLGVDYESINPAAYGFWTKHFQAYTCGVVRRVDERILKRKGASPHPSPAAGHHTTKALS